ncbi:hypothetical protein GQ43DRAFT_477126 [Delitschia confertaspora ATCC 74209]|uniref:Uncharacterized protein n=1 Tax=Delitschia confertaspora ATCC 74209 TaxID=1513339 RepID=A0A9P4JY79_9PLEO|nr:hypothetical protein GQ43DRAFT_477126 [Delitschia confertaspora ATCC 74209]
MLQRITIIAILASLVIADENQIAQITPMKRWVPAQPRDEDGPYFIAYFYNQTAWQGWNCNPGSTLTVTSDVAGCVSNTATSADTATTCADSSVLVGPSPFADTGRYTCPGGACQVGLIFQNPAPSKPTSIVSCEGKTAYTFSMFKATTRNTSASKTPVPAPRISIPNTSTPYFPSGSRTFLTASTGSATPSKSSDGQSSVPSGPNSNKSSSDKIALGVGIGVGIPAVLIALLAWCPRHSGNRHQVSDQERGG